MHTSPLNSVGYLIHGMGLSERITEAIENSGKSKADIARACGVTAASVTFWIGGQTKSLKAETALALEQATGYRANWLLSGTGPRKVGEATLVWPFAKVPVSRFLALSDDDKGYVQRRLMQAIAECEGQPSTEPERPYLSDGRKPPGFLLPPATVPHVGSLSQTQQRQVKKRKNT